MISFFVVLFFASECVAVTRNCADLDCVSCTLQAGCGFCALPGGNSSIAQGHCVDTSKENNATSVCEAVKGTFCQGELCQFQVCHAPCSAVAQEEGEFWPCSQDYKGQLLLMLFYGAILGSGAKLISDGSELLLELFPAYGTVIGALLLPILGAVPDAAIILVSGAAGTKQEAQLNLKVGVGTLAGSTIMLLTVAWVGSLWVGRCDFNEFGEAIDRKMTRFSWFHQGVSVDNDTPMNAKIMLGTSLLYLIVQIIVFFNIKDPSKPDAAHGEQTASLVGLVLCAFALAGYCVYQVLVPKLAKRRQQAIETKFAEKQRQLTALSVLNKFPAFVPLDERTRTETAALAVGKMWRHKALSEHARRRAQEMGSIQEEGVPEPYTNHDDDDDDESQQNEHDPRDHMVKNLLKAFALMITGTALVCVFSDPMVAVIGDFGNTVGVNAFIISFVVTPFCSNASELISSLIFASKKRVENASLTYGQIYGAVTLNNTLCLGIFYALIYLRGLYWSFSAETVAILLVTWIVGALGSFKQSFSLIYGLPVAVCYVASLGFVEFVEKQFHWE